MYQKPLHTLSRIAVVQVLVATLVLGTLPRPTYARPAPEPQADLRPVAELELKDGVDRAPSLPAVARAPSADLSARRLPDGSPISGLSTESPQVPKAAQIPTTSAPGPSLLRPEHAPLPEPGIQRQPLDKSGMLSQSVQPPQSPFDLVKHFPHEYAPPGEAATPSKSATAPELKIHPETLFFARTPAGLVPTSQTLEISTEPGTGARFEVAARPSWLIVSASEGEAGPRPTSLRLSIDNRSPDGDLDGELVIRNLDKPSDVRRVAVHLKVQKGDLPQPLESRDEDGRLQRVIRPDGSIVD